MKIKMAELLLIAGSGRNSGKTTMACAIIGNVSRYQPTIGIKITPHFHEDSLSGKILVNRRELVIQEETQIDSGKDSSRMLQAGAEKVYFVMAKDEQLIKAMEAIQTLNTDHLPVVCESGGLIHFFKPGLFLMMSAEVRNDHKPNGGVLEALADLRIDFDGIRPNYPAETINYLSNKWQIVPKY